MVVLGRSFGLFSGDVTAERLAGLGRVFERVLNAGAFGKLSFSRFSEGSRGRREKSIGRWVKHGFGTSVWRAVVMHWSGGADDGRGGGGVGACWGEREEGALGDEMWFW